MRGDAAPRAYEVIEKARPRSPIDRDLIDSTPRRSEAPADQSAKAAVAPQRSSKPVAARHDGPARRLQVAVATAVDENADWKEF